MGKRSDGHFVRQEEINVLLANKANEGNVVVRLKGGDPFVFGRGGEEMEFLQEAGVEVSVVLASQQEPGSLLRSGSH